MVKEKEKKRCVLLMIPTIVCWYVQATFANQSLTNIALLSNSKKDSIESLKTQVAHASTPGPKITLMYGSYEGLSCILSCLIYPEYGPQ